MRQTSNYLAIDLGASSGRVLLGQWDGEHFNLQELHRFANEPVFVMGHLYWNVLRLWADIKTGISRYASQFNDPLSGIGIDTWGVDYGLLDSAGKLLGNPYHYRDSRTNDTMEQVLQVIPRHEIFAQTGIQFMQINTLFQLYSMVQSQDPQLDAADTLLTMPSLFNYWLSGQKGAEYTHATTTQCFDARQRAWAGDLLKRLSIPSHIFPSITKPGTILGDLVPDVVAETGLRFATPVIVTAGHDTACAVAAIPSLTSTSAYISSGTWSLMGVEIAEPLLTLQALELNFTNEGGFNNTIRLQKNIAGLWLLQECRRQWQREGIDYTWQELLAQADQAPHFRSLVDPDATTFLSPGDIPTALAAYCKRTGQPSPQSVGETVRCCLESLALKYRHVLAYLESLIGHRLETVHIVGGGSQNRALCQFTADACDRPVIAGPAEATAFGNILVQAIARNDLSSVEAGRAAIGASVHLTTYEPHNRAAWDDAFSRFTQLGTLTGNC